MSYQHDKYDTSILPPLGIDGDIPPTKLEDIKNSEVAYLMLLNSIKSRDHYYQEAMEKCEYYRKQSENRRISVVFSTVAEFLLALGSGCLFAGYEITAIPVVLVLASLIFALVSAYYCFKSPRSENKQVKRNVGEKSQSAKQDKVIEPKEAEEDTHHA